MFFTPFAGICGRRYKLRTRLKPQNEYRNTEKNTLKKQMIKQKGNFIT